MRSPPVPISAFTIFAGAPSLPCARSRNRPPRLIGGHDLIALGFKPGPEFKAILREIEDLHLDGAISTRDEALAFVRENYSPAPSAGTA